MSTQSFRQTRLWRCVQCGTVERIDKRTDECLRCGTEQR